MVDIDGAYRLGQFRGALDRLFGDLLGEVSSAEETWGAPAPFPAVNIWEDAEALYVACEVPGLKMSDLDVSLVEGNLVIRGERRAPEDEAETVYHRQERGTGAFARSVPLPVEIDAERVTASLCDGVLTVTLPKAESMRPRKIDVKVSR